MQKKDYKFRETFSSFHTLIKNNKALIIPFLIVALLDGVALALIYFAPRPPIAAFLAPPIRKFWGDQFLHYPQNFVLIARLFNYAHIFISFTFGIIMTGIFIKMSQSYLEKRRHVLRKNVLLPAVVATLKKYIPMFIFFLIFYCITITLFKMTGKMIPDAGDTTLFMKCIPLLVNFVLSIILQTLFAFVFPALLVSDLNLVRAVQSNFLLVFKYFKDVLLIVLIPSLLYLLAIINKLLVQVLMQKFEPEMILVSICVSIVITTIIDFFITGYTTVFYINQTLEQE